ncbi:SDR family NAD(P)-dependent oxidoreductase [Gryllotalpicola ginsengisoli]|uniref:SDR family NAD(P)-dependent oxidoreductase n=1 Tax=Gryllotalpicola ginsengisoli TaxID=444608 RepID=UPI0003B31018|nr:SDR family NAD(P)-dependent oxidoreductase [Gryllotalpicola ginsengisoli]
MLTAAGRPSAAVIGATGGIGAAITAELARTHDVWATARQPGATGQLGAGIRPWRLDLAAPAAEVSVPAELESLAVLVLAAGAWSAGPVAAATDDDWHDTFAVNLFGQVAVTRALLPALRRGRGRVIVINSTAVQGSPGGRSAYTASKAALDVFARALHEEERDNGVQVSNIYPGRVATDMQKAVAISEGGAYVPERCLSPEAVAQTVRFVVDLAPVAHVAELVVRPPYRSPHEPPGSQPARDSVAFAAKNASA